LRSREVEVTVVDNDSRDDSWKAAQTEPGVRLSRPGFNSGFSAAANAAIAGSEKEFVLLLNPDIEVRSKSILRLYDGILTRPDAGIVCGPLMSRSGEIQREFQLRPLPSAWTVLKEVLFLEELIALFPGQAVPTEEWTELHEVEQPAAAFWLLRKRAWQDLEGFDERFQPAWWEDVDFCKRLRRTNWKILYHPDCPVIHAGGLAREQMSGREFYRTYYGNLLKYLRKHHRASYPFLWLPVKLGTWIRCWRRP
jgi:GT2 family glycosyltransferase